MPEDGKIVAWTIALGKPTTEQIAFFDKGLGGPASARLTVLRPGKTLYSRVVTQSPMQQLAPYFGQTVQFPLGRALNVKKGYVIALTVPTWAPALTPLLTDHSSWRASGPKGKCDDTATQTAQSALKQVAQYRCLYKARLTYSATLVTRPVPNPADAQTDGDVGSPGVGAASLTPAARSGTSRRLCPSRSSSASMTSGSNFVPASARSSSRASSTGSASRYGRAVPHRHVGVAGVNDA